MPEPNGPGIEAVVTTGQLPDDSGLDQETAADVDELRDPWFEPEPRGAGRAADGQDEPDGGDPHGAASSQAEWFLPAGRVGLLPDSMTESWDDRGHAIARPETAGAPPWAGDRAGPAREAPPPWESGPWPGPGEERPHHVAAADASPALSPADADTGNWQASAALGAGLLPVVVPGLLLGMLGLRRARVTGTGRTAAWLAIAFSAIWAAILVVWLASAGGTASGACGGYQNDVNYPVSQVLHDLATAAPPSVLSADLHLAITRANSAAAQAVQVPARNAMATLTAGLQQVAAEGSSASDAVRHQQVAADADALAGACRA